MRVTIFGASGGTGRHLTDQSLEAGYEVVAVVRSPASITTVHERLTVVAADVFDAGSLADAVTGADAVLSALGARSRSDAVCAPAVRAIIAAMAAAGTRRIVAVSAAPVGPPDEHDTWSQRHIARPLLWRFLAEPYRDMAAMEDELRASDLDWTVLRPPRLTDKPATGRYRTAVGHNLRKGRFLSRADLAGAVLRSLDDPTTVRAAVAVAY